MVNKYNRVALVGGSWSSNIGNSFYNIGAEWLLRELGLNVTFLPESPRWKEDVAEHYDLVAEADADLFILVGPCLWERLSYVYESTFDRIYKRGGKIAYLSAGMATYTAAEAEFVARFLERYPPVFVSTRDHACFQLLSSIVDAPIHSGLCASMFLNDAIRPLPLNRRPYIVFNFDDVEPELIIEANGSARIARDRCRIYPTKNGDREIIRIVNLSIDRGYSTIYRRPNSYHSDLPGGYCSILASASAVYSERVHTCATALVYGGQAQFIRHAPRSFEKRHLLFERLGVDAILERPCRLNMQYIHEEKQNMMKFLCNALHD